MCEIDQDLNFDVIVLYQEELCFKTLKPRAVLGELYE